MNQERILMRSPSVSAELQRAGYQRQKEKLKQREQTESVEAGQKRCFKCQKTKSRNDFYAHPQMADVRLGKCKECTKQDAAKRFAEQREEIRAYDAWRTRTESRRIQTRKYSREKKHRSPQKVFAWQSVHNAIKSKKLVRKPCVVCGNPKSEAHHEDYSKPLEVIWMCFKHHREIAHGQRVAS